MRLGIESVGATAVQMARPLPAGPLPGPDTGIGEPETRGGSPRATGKGILWPLQPGQVNGLELRCWRWSPLGLGGVAVSLALVIVHLLHRIRLRLGYGLPELPA